METNQKIENQKSVSCSDKVSAIYKLRVLCRNTRSEGFAFQIQRKQEDVLGLERK